MISSRIDRVTRDSSIPSKGSQLGENEDSGSDVGVGDSGGCGDGGRDVGVGVSGGGGAGGWFGGMVSPLSTLGNSNFV